MIEDSLKQRWHMPRPGSVVITGMTKITPGLITVPSADFYVWCNWAFVGSNLDNSKARRYNDGTIKGSTRSYIETWMQVGLLLFMQQLNFQVILSHSDQEQKNKYYCRPWKDIKMNLMLNLSSIAMILSLLE